MNPAPNTPHFTVRKKFLSQRWYVFVSLPSGEKRKIARFHSALEAEYWMQFHSQNWLDRHRTELGLTTSQAPV